MKLKYIGVSPVANGGTVPLPEGWPAQDHDEEDETVATAKVASGNYEAPPAPIKEK